MEGLCTDLRRQSDALDVDRPLLVIMLMGGTGVGKSTLLNALAGGSIAQASIVRPTTRDPVVYYHESVRHDRLDSALRHCRLIPHDRPNLEHKIIVDTPDVDSNDLANRDKLIHLLPVADIVLYVGSQEKYHDEIGWDLFVQQRRRRAFAFVLNKWDRCLHAADSSGLRPDEDLLADLRKQGFDHPLLFRTCSQLWVEHANGKAAEDGQRTKPTNLPEGEQFLDLLNWIEMGLTRLEIEAIKARGVSQLLQHLQQALAAVTPPDLTQNAERTRAAWTKPLAEEAGATTEVLLNTLEPYQREIEHHFALQGQRRFRGLMGGYLNLYTRMKYLGSNLREHFSILPRRSRSDVHTPAPWNLSVFIQACSDVAANRQMDARGKALANRLLVEADAQGFPVDLLTEPVENATSLDWRQRHAVTLNEVLHQVEQESSRPEGTRKFLQGLIVFLTDWVPPLALLAALVTQLWRYFDPYEKGYNVTITGVLLLPGVILLSTLVILHLLIVMLMPLRWQRIRAEFEKQLEQRLRRELETTYLPVPDEVVVALKDERTRIEKLAKETREVAAWLEQREQASSIAGLYGN
jgi:hypothetical protein